MDGQLGEIGNVYQLILEQLSTRFEVVIRDAGWVTAHLGILNLNVDVVRAEACYHGHVSYDLDILKVRFLQLDLWWEM